MQRRSKMSEEMMMKMEEGFRLLEGTTISIKEVFLGMGSIE
jgi:hypothetical protein